MSTTRSLFDLEFTQAVDTPDGATTSYSQPIVAGALISFGNDPVAGPAGGPTSGGNGTCVRFGGGRLWNLSQLDSVAFDRGSSATTITVVTKPSETGPGEGTVTIHVPPTADASKYLVEFMLGGGAGAHGNFVGWPLSLIQTLAFPGAA